VPPAVVTVTLTVPLDPAGETTVISDSESTFTSVAATEPNLTTAPAMKPLPLIVTEVPPTAGPFFGDSPVTVGAFGGGGGGATYVNSSAGLVALVPSGVVTVTCTVPVPAGEVAVIDVAESAVTVAAAEPNLTAVAPASPIPLMVTVVPPDSGPVSGLTPVTAGALAAGVWNVSFWP